MDMLEQESSDLADRLIQVRVNCLLIVFHLLPFHLLICLLDYISPPLGPGDEGRGAGELVPGQTGPGDQHARED